MKVVYRITLFLHLLNCFFLAFALFLSYVVRFGFTFKEFFAAFVQLYSSDNHFAGVDAHMNSYTSSFLLLRSFSVGDIFLPVNLDYFANLLPFVMSLHNLNFIILSDGHGSNIVFLFQFFRKRRHNLPVNVKRCFEMPFTVSSCSGQKSKTLHFDRWQLCNGRKREELNLFLLCEIIC